MNTIALAKDEYGMGRKPHKPMSVSFMIVVSAILAFAWAFAMPAHARGASVSVARAAPSIARSAPAVRSTPTYTRTEPVRRAAPAANPVYFNKSRKDCDLERNKKLKECQAKQR